MRVACIYRVHLTIIIAVTDYNDRYAHDLDQTEAEAPSSEVRRKVGGGQVTLNNQLLVGVTDAGSDDGRCNCTAAARVATTINVMDRCAHKWFVRTFLFRFAKMKQNCAMMMQCLALC